MKKKAFNILNARARKVRCIDNTDNLGMMVSSCNHPLLEVGAEYTVFDVEVHNWYTLLHLKEFPGITFNSVAFCETE